MSHTMTSLSEAQTIEALREAVEHALVNLELSKEPVDLYEPCRYILSSGGKRLRPVLLLLTAQSFGVDQDVAMPAALAIEVFHNFTLVHDDIMDHAGTRRGRETVHVRWDEATAILSGDYMMALSYKLLSELPAQRVGPVLQNYHHMVQMLCEGQAMDKAFETQKDVTLDAYFSMIERKTGALIQSAFEIGGIIGSATEQQMDQLRMLGKHLGRAFQIQDDLLDLIADHHKWGKKVGGDLIEGKKAYLLLKALSTATGKEKAFFQSIIENNGLPEDQIPQARIYMEALGVIRDANEAVVGHTQKAIHAMDQLPENAAMGAIRWLVLKMQQRVH